MCSSDLKTPAAVRDRTLTIPGSGGVRIPLRTDFFLFPKIIAEHTYLLMTNSGVEDPAKFRRSVVDNLWNAVLSPTLVPQIVKPVIEVSMNYDFFQQRPLIGTFEKNKDTARQFRESTSELSKLLGHVPLYYDSKSNKMEGISPIAWDHLKIGRAHV